ncbi:MAG TPA: MFS transporter [Microlunatus sp.]|nr:MFS transporter [Microlunatus sp.]
MTASTDSPSFTSGASARRPVVGPAAGVGVVVAIGLAAFNLRPAVTSVGPLLEEVRTSLGMSGAVAGLLTGFPALCFVVAGASAPRLVRRLGPALVLMAAMATVAIGLALRPYVGGTTGTFLLFSAAALAGIGVANVVMPVVVKRYFPERVGTLTGFYSMVLTLGASLAAATTVPLTHALGGDWRAGLAFWAMPALLAVIAWLPVVRRDRRTRAIRAVERAAHAASSGPRVWRSRTAWALGIFFGLQGSGAYVVMGWLPQIFRDAGFSAETAGLLLAATPAVGIPLSFLLPSLAGRMRSQGGLVVALSALGLVAYAGLGVAPTAAPWLWVVLLGASQSTFPLALAMIGLRARSTTGVVRLSAFAQSLGYLLSVAAPVLVGVLYAQTGGWSVPIALMAALLVPQAVTGYLAGRPRWIEDEVSLPGVGAERR